MQALILAGGEGTRLRPLTSTIPKPVVPLAGRPFITYMLGWLKRHGVDDVVMSCGFLADGVRAVLGEGAGLGLRIRYVEEPEPLGTGGALKFAEPLLDERFFMLNGDVLTDIDLTAQLEQHERTGARGTLALIAVPDPSAYGLVRLDADLAVTEFLEKPAADEIDSNLVNAGAYILERGVLDGMPPAGTNCSIERDVFPRLVGCGLYGHEVHGHWLDIGTPDRYLQATHDILSGALETDLADALARHDYVVVADGATVAGQIIPPALIGAETQIHASAVVGAGSALGERVRVEAAAVVEGSAVLDDSVIGEGSAVRGSIVGRDVVIGPGCTIEGGVVLGEGVRIGAGNVLRAGARIFPGVEFPEGAIRF